MSENEQKKTQEQRQRVNSVNVGNLKQSIKNGTLDEQLELIKSFKSEVLIAELQHRLLTNEQRVEAIEKITKATF